MYRATARFHHATGDQPDGASAYWPASASSNSRPMYASVPAMPASASMNDHFATDSRLRSDDEMYAECGSSRRPSSSGGRVSGSAVFWLASNSSVEGMPCVRSGRGNPLP